MFGRSWAFLAGGLATWLIMTAAAVGGGLEEYVGRPDEAFAWKQAAKEVTPAGTIYRLELTSQLWHGIAWTHRLRVYVPKRVQFPAAMLLFVVGGSQETPARPDEDATGFQLAELCGAPCAILNQVPNQPLLGGKSEDALIAETFVRYLDTRDESWLLLYAMTKGAVRAMDALQAWARSEGRPDVKKFVVTGASKRGWTTWLTGSVDRRVAAIAPMVIDTLNMRAQGPHQREAFGDYSEQIQDYTDRGLVVEKEKETPELVRLWTLVDPLTYRDQLAMPKLLINGTNDRYWALDALNLYWDELRGPKAVVYLPNSGHGLDQHRDYATHGIGALFRHTLSGRPMPELSWHHTDAENGSVRLTVNASTPPREARLWVARSETRDFRSACWEPALMRGAGGSRVGEVPRPETGLLALFADLEFAIDEVPYHLSTQIRIVEAREARE